MSIPLCPSPEVLKQRQEWYGRLQAFDPRDHDYRVKKVLRAASGHPKSRYHHPAPTLDQGPTPRCVAFSTCQLLRAGPVFNNRQYQPDDPVMLGFADDWYHECQRNDEWDGEDYAGTSVRASMKVGQLRGYWKEYRWAFDVQEIADAIIQVGPAVFGTVWTPSMDEPDARGYLKVDGDADTAGAGGHAYCVYGVSKSHKNPDGSKGVFAIQNSWGEWGVKKYGVTGTAYLTFDAADRLMKMGGECGVPAEVKQG